MSGFGKNIDPTYNCTIMFVETKKRMIQKDEVFWLIILLLTALYLPVMIMIYRNRHQQAVIFKSPQLILLGGFSFFMDSVLNCIINWERPSQETVCYLSIFDTLTWHYSGYFSLIFRAFRIFKVMRLEKKYLNKIYNLTKDNNPDKNGTIENDASPNGSVNDPMSPINMDNRKLLSASEFEK
jgi:hypothetical protein